MPRTFQSRHDAAEFLLRCAGRTRTSDGGLSQDLINAVASGGLIDTVFSDACRSARNDQQTMADVRRARTMLQRPTRQPA